MRSFAQRSVQLRDSIARNDKMVILKKVVHVHALNRKVFYGRNVSNGFLQIYVVCIHHDRTGTTECAEDRNRIAGARSLNCPSVHNGQTTIAHQLRQNTYQSATANFARGAQSKAAWARPVSNTTADQDGRSRSTVARTTRSFLAVHFLCGPARSEEHTSELQSRGHLVCRLLLGKKKRRQE